MPTFKNWGENLHFEPEKILYPTSETEIIEIVKEAHAKDKKIRVVGAGHSWTGLIPTDQYLVSLDQYQGLIEVDKTYKMASVKAGTTLSNLGKLLQEQGLAMENLGDIDSQSIAGAISTGTHGTGIRFGSIATQVIGLTFINGQGERITCSPTQQADLFSAAQVSLGALGILTEVKLRLEEAFKLEYICKKSTFQKTLTQLENYITKHRHFEFYCFPYSKNVQLKFVNKTKKRLKNTGFLNWLNETVLENTAFGLLCRYSRMFPSQAKKVSRLCGKLISDVHIINHSHLVFATPRTIKFNEMEYNIPIEHFEAAIQEVMDTIEAQQFQVHFPIECRFVHSDDIMISPANGRHSAYIAVHAYQGMPYRDYFAAMEQIFRKYHGRPHYGKMNTATFEDFKEMYPQWEQFLDIRARQDEKGIFVNDYLKRIFGW